MIARIAGELGPWTWWVLGMILLGVEVLIPGVFLVWIGIAAIVVGMLSLAFWDASFWIWEIQIVLFAFLSVLAVLAGRRLVSAAGDPSDEPFLNRREASLVGRTAILDDPILEGRGRIRLDDTVWMVEGPDLPIGTRVRVVAAGGRHLTVESI